MPDIDASILFPNDGPSKPADGNAAVPEWYAAQRDGAELRLAGKHGVAGDGGSLEGEDAEDPATAIFKNEAGPDYDELMEGELGPTRLSAHSDGDTERADALKAAMPALAANFREAGTDTESLKEAFDVVRESAGIHPPTPEQREESFNEGMAAIQSEGIADADLNAARTFIRDLEMVSPGVVASLEAHGAGNNPRLIRAAIREAKRRGYR